MASFSEKGIQDPSREGSRDPAAVIVGNDAANRVQVVPVSSKTDKLYPCEDGVTVDGRESKAMAGQIMIMSKEWLTERLGLLSPHEMHRVDMAMRIQLGLAAWRPV